MPDASDAKVTLVGVTDPNNNPIIGIPVAVVGVGTVNVTQPPNGNVAVSKPPPFWVNLNPVGDEDYNPAWDSPPAIRVDGPVVLILQPKP